MKLIHQFYSYDSILFEVIGEFWLGSRDRNLLLKKGPQNVTLQARSYSRDVPDRSEYISIYFIV
jgi:hypothetical protein